MQSCDDCRRWVHNPDGTRLTRHGHPVPRDREPACGACEKHNDGLEDWTDESRRIWGIYNQVKAGRQLELSEYTWHLIGLLEEMADTITDRRASLGVAALAAAR